ncbi:hypothetical protein B0T14DRAFT_403563, partial [Immersiella caudata]
DWRRVNVTNPELISQIMDYIGPSLKRHEGCDIIDMYPGAGAWSNALHERLRPRSHILMEPNAGFYQPFLQSLLDKPGVVMEAKDGIDWKELGEILTPKYLPHQVEKPRTYGPDAEPPQRNDTLLVTMNLSMHPSRRFLGFDSLSLMVIHQLIGAIRTSGLFQKYGLVRMLIWTKPDDMRTALVRHVQGRRRGIIDAEMNTDWVREVAGLGLVEPTERKKGHWSRSRHLDVQSAFNAARRMREHGIIAPPNRQSELLRMVQPFLDSGLTEMPLSETPGSGAHIAEELEELQRRVSAGEIVKGTAAFLKYTRRKHYYNWIMARNNQKADLMAGLDAVKDLYDAGDLEKAAQADAEWNQRFTGFVGPTRVQTISARDNEHIFYQDPPVLHWDRRLYEPLIVRPEDFYPNIPCALLDIQPKAPHWLFRDIGPNSVYRAGDFFELILRHTGNSAAMPLSKAFASIYPGVKEGVLDQCRSIHDTSRHGSPVSGWGELSTRCLNEEQWVDIMQSWVHWPFGPNFFELVSSLVVDDPGMGASEDD